MKTISTQTLSVFAAIILILASVTNVNAQTDCDTVNSSNNLLKNASFETALTADWAVANGNIYISNGYQICGSQNAYFTSPGNGTDSWAYTEIPLQPVGQMIKVSGYFGTHAAGQSCSPFIRIGFYNSSWGLIDYESKNITTNVDVAPYKSQKYSLNRKVPIGTAHIRFEVRILCDVVKMDAISITAPNAGTLPLDFLSVSAFATSKNKVDLAWKTATEINVSHFIIEKSTDGVSYTDAGIVMAANIRTGSNNYQFTDNLANNTTVAYYRIRSVDFDGKSQRSEIKMVRLTNQSLNQVQINAFPNPAISNISVGVPAKWQNKMVQYEVMNMNGQVVAKEAKANAGQIETINIQNLQSGNYLIRVICNGEVASQKIVKQ